jgi:sugar phosphate isomerase/epimerase
MKFGICTKVENAAAVKAAGWDYVEESVQGLLKGQTSDAEWDGLKRTTGAALPVPAANSLVPGSLPITGPSVNEDALTAYMTHVLGRAKKVGIKTLVFGSAGARNVPEGFSRDKAREQIIRFLKNSVGVAKQNDVTLVAEPLNRGESNVINSVEEAMTYVKAVDHPNFQCLVDSYHFWLEDEPLSNLKAAMPWIKHVHLADKDGRVAPGLSGKADYVPFFKVLKEGNYSGLISFEGKAMDDFDSVAPKVLEYVKKAWAAA